MMPGKTVDCDAQENSTLTPSFESPSHNSVATDTLSTMKSKLVFFNGNRIQHDIRQRRINDEMQAAQSGIRSESQAA